MNLLKRCLVAAAAVPAIYLLVRLGSLYLAFFLAALAALAAWEFYSLARRKELKPMASPGIVLAAVLPVVTYLVIEADCAAWLRAGFMLSFLVVALSAVILMSRDTTEGALAGISVTVFGILYTGGLFSFQVLLRHGPHYPALQGFKWLFLVYLVTWGVDVGSYACGRLFGRHKLCPSLSPGKTVEGFAGGIIFAAAVSYLAGAGVFGIMAPGPAVLFGIVLSLVAPAGDLVESIFKRDAGVKDSSSLIPGHGGVLDRFDSLLFTAPAAVLFRYIIFHAAGH
ncbi:MAG: phosphatidate cytidylyltransferase [Gemmatimonadota bacterium]|nr:phosphatidate cytidylyltransferase [Gemmatimonadota bacterium]